MPKFFGYIVILCMFYIIPYLVGTWLIPESHMIWRYIFGYAIFVCLILISFKIVIWLTPRKDDESIIHMHSEQDTKPGS
jgi:hypothetical protein